ncbi:hypothetical protein DM860_001094 [Cuscuta australis]|uniref:Uncharacterized protein n=1 Tax=Cuscuta australis TaxID=267555 RepID=A0A328DT00_9ASTE|nr:hypothetical protein DM860_001094 [Cuscuta australis]
MSTYILYYFHFGCLDLLLINIPSKIKAPIHLFSFPFLCFCEYIGPSRYTDLPGINMYFSTSTSQEIHDSISAPAERCHSLLFIHSAFSLNCLCILLYLLTLYLVELITFKFHISWRAFI